MINFMFAMGLRNGPARCKMSPRDTSAKAIVHEATLK